MHTTWAYLRYIHLSRGLYHHNSLRLLVVLCSVVMSRALERVESLASGTYNWQAVLWVWMMSYPFKKRRSLMTFMGLYTSVCLAFPGTFINS